MQSLSALFRRPNAFTSSMMTKSVPQTAGGLLGLLGGRFLSSRAPSSSYVSLNNIADNRGAYRQRKRVGRGIGSGKGKTAAKGLGGQRKRNWMSKPYPGFEGGQFPFYRRIPKIGFKNHSAIQFHPLNLDVLSSFIERGLIDSSKPITMHTLYHAGVVGKIWGGEVCGVKLLGDGASHFEHKVNLEVSRVSKTAAARIAELGGSVKEVYFTQLGIRALLKPWKFERLPLRATPPPRLQKYYPDHTKAIPHELPPQ